MLNEGLPVRFGAIHFPTAAGLRASRGVIAAAAKFGSLGSGAKHAPLVPAKAGTHGHNRLRRLRWIPAFASLTRE